MLYMICMFCNVIKTVFMVFSPKDKLKIVAQSFPAFCLGGNLLKFVSSFKYLGHILTDKTINREIRNMFVRTNTLKRKFTRCSSDVKLILFKSYCMNLYDSALWTHYWTGSFKCLQLCYNKCLNLFWVQ